MTLTHPLVEEQQETGPDFRRIESALIAAKREMWIGARDHWTLADFKNWAVIQDIDAALVEARRALLGEEGHRRHG